MRKRRSTPARAAFLPTKYTSSLRKIASVAKQLAKDHNSGSVELSLRACSILANCPAGDSRHTNALVQLRLARTLADAQPSMAAVRNVCERWLSRVRDGEAPRGAASSIRKELVSAQQAAVRKAATLVRNGTVVATFSYSSSVLAALLLARQQDRKFRVLCAEGRPMCEGRKLARRLARAGILTEIFTDAGLLSVIPTADIVLIGCDAVLPGGFVNKVGTNSLACVARKARVPVYVIADFFKLLTQARREKEKNPAEVWRTTQRGLRVRNLCFEKTPLDDCTAFITGQGLWNAGNVRTILRKLELSRVL